MTAETAASANQTMSDVLQELDKEDYEMETLDVVQDQEQAKALGIIKAPALAVFRENDLVKVIYSLNDSYEIRYALGLSRLW